MQIVRYHAPIIAVDQAEFSQHQQGDIAGAGSKITKIGLLIFKFPPPHIGHAMIADWRWNKGYPRLYPELRIRYVNPVLIGRQDGFARPIECILIQAPVGVPFSDQDDLFVIVCICRCGTGKLVFQIIRLPGIGFSSFRLTEDALEPGDKRLGRLLHRGFIRIGGKIVMIVDPGLMRPAVDVRQQFIAVYDSMFHGLKRLPGATITVQTGEV